MGMHNLAFAPPKHDKLRALGIMALNGMFDEMDGVAVIRQAVTDLLEDDIAIVSSFGADSSVLLHMVAQVDPGLPVYFLETNKHKPKTLRYVETQKTQQDQTKEHKQQPDPKDQAQNKPQGDQKETDPD